MTTSITDIDFSAAPKIVVLGATGPTGRHIVSQALSSRLRCHPPGALAGKGRGHEGSEDRRWRRP